VSYVNQNQFNALTVLADANQQGTPPALQSGDILISHRHAGTKKWEDKAFHASTIVIKTSHDSTQVRLYESMPQDGVRSIPWTDLDDDCTVFRPWGVGSPEEAAASAALQAVAFREAGVGYSDHGVGRAILCGVGKKTFGEGARKRLEKYQKSARHAPKNCVCSEYVVLCYQMALNIDHRQFIKLDAKFTTPWNLEDYLMNNINWTLAGAFKGKPKPK
jgi:hypothetical protein